MAKVVKAIAEHLDIDVSKVVPEASLIDEKNLITPKKKREQERKAAEEKKRLADAEDERIRI